VNDPAAEQIRFGDDGLVPAVVQDAATGDVLMVAFMNDEALRLTYATGEAHYWSRSRKKLWHKGETSGHTQTVAEIRINCERNSLLLLVRQTGAVCHDGYPTCYYRRLAPDGALTVVRERAFDPATVYGEASNLSATRAGRDAPAVSFRAPARTPRNHLGSDETAFPGSRDESWESSFVGMTRGDYYGSGPERDRLAEATRRQFGAYAYLRDHDLTAESATSRRLRQREQDFGDRVGDELRELAGVLDGSHQHADFTSDLRLEASQVLYWVIVQALRHGVSWSRLRPDRALSVNDVAPDRGSAARLLRAEAERWSPDAGDDDLAAKAHATLALVALACRSGGLDPLAVVASDLEELRTRPYLAAYFELENGIHERDQERERSATS
jgi:phosphoribosyl-AMP cyclohydrolase